MGREARSKKAREVRITLPEADFFRLVSAARYIEVQRLEARQKAERLANEFVQKEIAQAAAKGKALFEALGKKHGFDPLKTYRFDEDRCQLIEVRAHD